MRPGLVKRPPGALRSLPPEEVRKIRLESQTHYLSTEKGRKQQRRSRLIREYGITPEQYDEMWAAQKGLCAICGRPERYLWRGQPRPLAIDHDHVTARVRGLLCRKCNQGLGHFEDNPNLMRAALEYLQPSSAVAKVPEALTPEVPLTVKCA